MNKKVNTLLFILCATLFNIIIVLVSFIVLTLIYLKFFMMKLPESSRSWVFTTIFLTSIAISILVYRVIIKYYINKIDIEKYFDPLFVSRHRK